MKLTVLNNNIQYSEFEVDNDSLFPGMEFFIGRDEECHIALNDHKVSRHHAMLIFENLGVWKLKKVSSNGRLEVNGSSVEEKNITESDKIQIFDFVLKLTDLDPKTYSDDEDKTEVLSKTELMNSESLSQSLEKNTDDNDSPINDIEKSSMQAEEDLTHENLLSEFDESDYEGDIQENSIDENQFDDHGSVDEAVNDQNSFEENDSPDEYSENDQFSDDFGFSENAETDNNTDKTQVFKGFAKYELKLYGENVPYTRFLLEDSKEILIGRSDECDIVLQDVEVSSQHAKLKKTLSFCELEDLGSGNGTFYKGERVNKAELVHGDEFVIGGTTFSVEVQSDLIDAESDRLMPVDENQIIETEEIVEEEADFDENELTEPKEQKKGLSLKAILADPKRKRIFYIVCVLLIFLLLFDEEDTSSNNDQAGKINEKSVKKVAPTTKKNLSKEMREQLEQSYLLARSYYSEGKYAECIAELDKIRAVDPDYKQTSALFKNAKEGLKRLQEAEKKKREEEERRVRMIKVKELLIKANDAIKNKQVVLAEELFSQIYELDPENLMSLA